MKRTRSRLCFTSFSQMAIPIGFNQNCAAEIPHKASSKQKFSRESVCPTDRKRVTAMRNGFLVLSLHTHTLTLSLSLSLDEQLWTSWNTRIQQSLSSKLHSPFRVQVDYTVIFCKKSWVGETNGFISHPATKRIIKSTNSSVFASFYLHYRSHFSQVWSLTG